MSCMQKRTIQVLSILLLLGLLLWGGYSTIAYFGVPVHMSVLLSDAAKTAFQQRDCANSLFTCGALGLLPSLWNTVARAGSFFGYALFSAVLFGLYFGWQVLTGGSFRTVRVRGRPITFLLTFLALLWLLFTVLSLSQVGEVSMRQISEPSPLVYADATPSVLLELQKNFDGLMKRGCLSQIGTYTNGAKAYQMSVGCIQESFFTRVIPVFLFTLLLLFELLITGRMILRLCRFPRTALLPEAAVSAGVGACAWIAALWFLAVAHLIIAPAGWILVFLVPLIGYKDAMYWLKTLIRGGEERDVHWLSVETFLAWLLLSYLALNFLTVVRPFPIGWDDLGSYLNRPRLMVSYGHFIFSMAPFQWEYLTSLGFLLFGYGSIFGATTSMMVNWLAGALAVLTVFTFARMFLGRPHGLLSALLYLSLPLVGHFSFADMKVDNAVFVMGALAMFVLFVALFPRAGESEEMETPFRDRLKWIALAGVLVGFDFAMKPTAVMVLMTLLAVLLGASVHWTAFFGMVSFAIAAFIEQGALDITQIMQRVGGPSFFTKPVVLIGSMILGCLLVGGAFFLRRSHIKPALLSILVFLVAFGASIFPWVYHDNFLLGRLIPTRLELGAPNSVSPDFDLDGTAKGGGVRPLRSLPSDLRVDKSLATCSATGASEELDRYWGYRKGSWEHYFTLPWRITLNLDSAGYYVTTSPVLFLFPLLLLLPFFWMRRGRWVRWLFAATTLLVLEWIFLANGIPWYGIGVFLGLLIGVEILLVRSPDFFSRSVAGVLIACGLFASFGQRLWQFEVQRNMLEYAFGKITASALQERTISHYDDIAKMVIDRSKSMPDRPYLYRVGTFIPYFIPRNLELIGTSDHQLDFFNCLFAERDSALTLKRLKVLGFNSIIFDTNTATIEKDTNGSLHQKVNAFLTFANTHSLGLVPEVNDPDGGVAYILLP